MTARTVVALVSSAAVGVAARRLYELLRDPGRDADPGEDRRHDLPARAGGRLRRRRVAAAIDANTETARLLRSQLRSKQDLRSSTPTCCSLAEEMDKRMGRTTAAVVRPAVGRRRAAGSRTRPTSRPYEEIFSDAEYWKTIGDEYQDPLIITGSVLFTAVERSGMVSRPQSSVDPSTGLEAFRRPARLQRHEGLLADAQVHVHRRAHRGSCSTARNIRKKCSIRRPRTRRPCRPISS